MPELKSVRPRRVVSALGNSVHVTVTVHRGVIEGELIRGNQTIAVSGLMVPGVGYQWNHMSNQYPTKGWFIVRLKGDGVYSVSLVTVD